jgi:DNA-binding LacI/PurR family transcriptional regulator
MPTRRTLKEVAAELGVSTATISNAFNRPDQLSAKLREQILEQCQQLGYHGPNLAARSLRRGESDVIAVVLADSLSYNFSDPVANQFLQGVADVLAQHEKQLLLLTSLGESQHQSSAESLPDGIIFYGAPAGKSFERILRTGKPALAVDFEQDQIGSVNIDNFDAARMAAQHLFSQSVRTPAIMGLRLKDSEQVENFEQDSLPLKSGEISCRRLAGYLQAAQECDYSIPHQRIWHIPLNKPELAEQAVNQALAADPRPDGLLCMSDVIALAAIRVARQQGLQVPQDIKIVGFDDIPEASRSNPALTSVCQQSRQKGQLAATRLLNKELEGETLMSTKLVIRESSRS